MKRTYTPLKTSKQFFMYQTKWIGGFGKKRIFSSPKCIFSTPPTSVESNNWDIFSWLLSTP
jgi:hypothetical protein